MDRADESARKILYSGPGALDRPNDPLAERIAQAIRKAQGDIAGDVCPHWTVEGARRASTLLTLAATEPADFALRDEIDMLIEQVKP